MMEIKLSIIVPVYNVENYLGDCLDSLVKQDLAEMEIICVNDGSTDGSLGILKEYKKMYPAIKIVNKENGGLSSARNLGLKKAKGKYIVFMDSDDIWVNSSVASYIVNGMDKDNLDMFVFGIEPFFENEILEKRFDSSKEYYNCKKSYGFFEHGFEMLEALRQGRDYICSACIRAIKRELIAKNNLKFYEGIIHEDQLFTFILLMNVGRCRHVNKVLYSRRYRSDSIMTKKKCFKNIHGFFTVWKESFSWLEKNKIPKEAEKIAKEMLWSFGNMLRNGYRALEQDEQKKIESYNVADQYLLSSFLLRESTVAPSGNPYAFPYHLVPLKSRIVLYGAGDVGRHMWRQIQTERMVSPVAMLDKNADKIKQANVLPIGDVSKLIFDYVVIAIKDEGIAKAAKKTLLDIGIKADAIKWDGGSYDVDKFHKNIVGPLLGRI